MVTYVEHHRTVGDWVDLVVDAGLVLDRLVEPEWKAGNDSTWGGWSPLRGAIIPGTLILRHAPSPPSVRPPRSADVALVRGVVPGSAESDGDVERHRERVGPAHLVLDAPCVTASRSPSATSRTSSSCTCSSSRDASPVVAESPFDREHRHLHDVRSRPLDRRVERHPLGHLTALPVVAGEVGKVATASQHASRCSRSAARRRPPRPGSRAPRRSGRSTRPSAPWPRPVPTPSCWLSP